VSPKVVYDLTKVGVLEHGAGRLYPLEDSVRRYCDHIRGRTAGKPRAENGVAYQDHRVFWAVI